MKLFRRTEKPQQPADNPPVPTPATSHRAPPHRPAPKAISLSAEQKSILAKPVDPRVNRILQNIYADKAAAERALNAQRVIDFPRGTTGKPHVVQESDGFWRIVPGSAPVEPVSMMDAL